MTDLTLTNDQRMQRRVAAMVAAAGVITYLVFCWFFFDVPSVFSGAKWERAAAYTADWYSWDAAPRFRFENEGIRVEWTRSLLGDNPEPEWIEQTGEESYTVTIAGPGNRVEISPTEVVAILDGTAYPVPITAAGADLPANAPSEFSLKSGRVTVDYGFAGLAEIRNTQVYVRKRFLGWPNFFFDTKSPFFGMSTAELWQSATSGERIHDAAAGDRAAPSAKL